jgi:YD repeat-containing protein
MNTKYLSFWESIHTSFWFLPALMAAIGVALSYAMLRLDQTVSVPAWKIEVILFPGGPEGARLVLSTIAGSTITVAGVIFSITIAALAMAGAQFGPRLLRSFVADKGNQVTLGTFVGTFIYCLLVSRTVEEDNAARFVPAISVTVAILLALASFGVLIYFFHHASSSIQAEQVVDTIYRELLAEIDRTFPEEGEPGGTPAAPPTAPKFDAGVAVLSHASGYLRAVDGEGLLALAAARDLVIRLEYRPGDFVFERTPLAVVVGRGEIDEYVHKHVRDALILGTYRSLEQDVEFPIQQLVDMALRALSAALNDPYTAVNCIDRLGAGICHLNARGAPTRYRYDGEGNLRVILDVPTYEGMLDAAFNQIRQSATHAISVTIRLLEALQAIAVTTRSAQQRQAVRQHAEMIHRAGQAAATEKRDSNDLEKRFREFMQKLESLD